MKETFSLSSQKRIEIVSLAVLIAAIMAFYAVFVRPGMPWADDWATYLQGTFNLLRGAPYAATGYVVNPDTDIGPGSYPPLYPVMLILPVALWGMDFDAIRQFHLIGWAVFLAFAFFLTRRRLNFPLSLLVVAATGFSPYFFEFKDYLASEVLFLALLYSTFVLAERFEERAHSANFPLSAGIWIGAMAALCLTTRSVGVILVPVLGAYDLLKFRRIRRATWIAMTIAAGAFVLQFTFAGFLNDYISGLLGSFGFGSSPPPVHPEVAPAPSAGGLPHTLPNLLSAAAHRLANFVSETSRFWGNRANADPIARIASVVFGVGAIYGFSKLRPRTMLLCDVFALVYTAALFVLPPILAGARMQMPLAPLFYTYVLIGVTPTTERGRWLGRAGLTAVVVLGLLSYWHSYRNADWRTPMDGIEATDYHDMFDYIRKNTDPKNAIIFDKPRTLALYTGRRTAAIYGTRKGDQLLAYMDTIGARYILFYDGWHDGSPREAYLNDYFRNHAGDFEMLHDSGHYVLYRMKG